tara:strand:- start:101 stop:421 length:321 start_codon:yes stop_codon:yes gene_type:complete
MIKYFLMKKLLIFHLFIFFLFFSGCETIKKKSDEVVKKENEELSKYIGKSYEELKITLGNPDEDLYSEDGYRLIFYKKKKYGITCERRFEFDESDKVIGFMSKGCF